MADTLIRILIDKDDIRTLTIDPDAVPEALMDGAISLAIDRFALTANNVTYAATGRVLNYWDFFPAEDNWGCVPVWGYADVVASRCEGIPVGERMFGLLPMASLAVIQPQKVTDHSVVDGLPHRADLALIYNQYARVDNANTDRSLEDKHMIFYPLFVTAFLMQDFFAEHDYFGARTITVSSASSKQPWDLLTCLPAQSFRGPGS